MVNLNKFKDELKGKSLVEANDLFWLEAKPEIDTIVCRLDLLYFTITERYPKQFPTELRTLQELIKAAHAGNINMKEISIILNSMASRAPKIASKNKK